MKVAQLCQTLCNPRDCSLPGSSVHGILQARILEWVAVPFSREPSQHRDRTQVSHTAVDSLPSEPPGKPSREVKTISGDIDLKKQKLRNQKSNNPQLRTEWRGLKADCCMLSHVWLFTTLWTVACQASLPWDLSGEKTKEDCHFLHQGIFPTKRSNPHFLCLLHCRRILYCWATGEAKSRLDAT